MGSAFLVLGSCGRRVRLDSYSDIDSGTRDAQLGVG